MIKKLSSNTNQELLETLVEIHKRCILVCNSKKYNKAQIDEWLSTINSQSIKDQLENTTWLILEKGKVIVGFAQYSLDNEELYQIQIDPKEQGKGYGKELYYYIENTFRKNNIKNISLFSTLNAVPFYEKLGFKSIKTILFKLLSTEIGMVKMRKELI
jgi:N-acetylglutamate synthase-like GNAT family acetyltransferase